ncbi:MAG TPA: zf-HC2 domain-containing protein [Anaeromyxobacteraceae bacterium]|nr:zf-HC2 domain-containing protein [Anaeromyxobacteraceae bacterium]
MTCGEVERLVDPWLDGELDDRDQAEVLRHHQACPACRARAERRSRERAVLRAKLREAMGPGTRAGTAPEALRERLLQALDRPAAPWWRRALAPVPLATLAAAAAGVLMVLATHGGTDSLVEEAVVKHTRDLPLDISTAAMAPDAIPAALAHLLEFNPRPPRFEAQGVRLMGARAAHLGDRPCAYMRYQTPSGQMGLFVVADRGSRFPDLSEMVRASPPSVRVLNARGYNVAVWREHEMVYSLVSDLDAADLARLVEAARGARAR